MSTLKNNEQKESETKTRPWTEKDKSDLIELYPCKTNAELCEILEKSEGQVRGMKERLGLNQKFRPFTKEEICKVEEFYESRYKDISLDDLAKELGRSKIAIQRNAKRIGLKRKDRKLSKNSKERLALSLSKYRETDEYKENVKLQQERLLKYYAQNEHPRGMLGKHHSKEVCEKLSISHIELFANMTTEEKHCRAMRSVETRRKNGNIGTTNNAYSRCKGGFREDLSQYFRSAWESNVARILNYLHIEWKYEFKRFNFLEEKSDVLSYQPDFYLPDVDKWIEVKGWMDVKSKKRLELFNKYYPQESSKLVLIDEKEYRLLEKEYSKLINNWE